MNHPLPRLDAAEPPHPAAIAPVARHPRPARAAIRSALADPAVANRRGELGAALLVLVAILLLVEFMLALP